MKKITVWSPKGGQGKTSISLALAMEYGFLVVTNDTHSPIDEVMPRGHAMRLAPGEAFPEIDEDDKLIYDLGGNSEARVIEAAKQSDAVIMPLIYNSEFELQVFLEGVDEMTCINPKIILVVNGCERGQFKPTCAKIAEHFPDLPIVEVKKSKFFARQIVDGLSISDICKSNPLYKFHFKNVKQHLDRLITQTFEVAHGQKAI